jgi:hypothetical protein
MLSPDEAESVLRWHFQPASIDARIACGSYQVHWAQVSMESYLSFEDAIERLAREHPQSLLRALDEPTGMLRKYLDGHASQADALTAAL